MGDSQTRSHQPLPGARPTQGTGHSGHERDMACGVAPHLWAAGHCFLLPHSSLCHLKFLQQAWIHLIRKQEKSKTFTIKGPVTTA